MYSKHNYITVCRLRALTFKLQYRRLQALTRKER